MDDGSPVSYLVLEAGVAIRSADGHPVGTVRRVLAAVPEDIFDGIVIDTDDGERFVDADRIEAIYERAVVLTIVAAEATRLPEPEANPPAIPIGPDGAVPDDPPDDGIGGAAKRAWNRLSGNS